jgi:hypothetical protein
MKRLSKILVPTDLSEKSVRALHYGCWLAAEDKAALVILHVANGLKAWELYCEDLANVGLDSKPWPLDRVLAEASLDLTRYLEPQQAQQHPCCDQACRLGLRGATNLGCRRRGKSGFDRHVPRQTARLETFARWRHGAGDAIEPLSRAIDYDAVAFKTVARQDQVLAVRLAASNGG